MSAASERNRVRRSGQTHRTRMRTPALRAKGVQQSESAKPSVLIVLNKPYGVLTQFSDELGRTTLKDYVKVPEVYPAGRLDSNSEGLLLLTNDGRLQARIAEPKYQMPKTYWVQVEGTPSPEQVAHLEKGVMLKDGLTLPAKVQRLAEPTLWPRTPPVRYRADIPTSWLALTITEGRNRQVRRMTAAVGLPTLRLVRVKIGPWELTGLAPGEWREDKQRP